MSDDFGFWFFMAVLLLAMVFGGAQCQVSITHRHETAKAKGGDQ